MVLAHVIRGHYNISYVLVFCGWCFMLVVDWSGGESFILRFYFSSQSCELHQSIFYYIFSNNGSNN